MLLEDYILYTVENHNNIDEMSTQPSVRVNKETNVVQGWYSCSLNSNC